MRIQYAKEKSDSIARADGTYVVKEKKKKKLKGSAELRKQTWPMVQQLRVMVDQQFLSANQESVPNNILFVQNLPLETTSQMLQLLFIQYPGFKEGRMIEAKPGIAFVEYEDDVQAGLAMQHLQGFKITAQDPMAISFAKK